MEDVCAAPCVDAAKNDCGAKETLAPRKEFARMGRKGMPEEATARRRAFLVRIIYDAAAFGITLREGRIGIDVVDVLRNAGGTFAAKDDCSIELDADEEP